MVLTGPDEQSRNTCVLRTSAFCSFLLSVTGNLGEMLLEAKDIISPRQIWVSKMFSKYL